MKLPNSEFLSVDDSVPIEIPEGYQIVNLNLPFGIWILRGTNDHYSIRVFVFGGFAAHNPAFDRREYTDCPLIRAVSILFSLSF